MKQRIITGAIILIVLLLVVFFSWTPIFPAVLSLCSVIAVFEMARCIGLKKAYPLTLPLYILAAVYPFLMRYIADKDFLRQIHFIVIMCVPLYFFAIMTFSHGKYRLEDVSVLFMTVFYILLGFNAIMILYSHRGGA
ncbi:MAG: phosphatidate cytidylyltransferase, partial [Clostridia bacterium]|nr:phosphatidate cytidylyltransferase [Clostridia bacterium]